MAIVYAQISPSKKIYVGQHIHGTSGVSFARSRMNKTDPRIGSGPIQRAFVKYGKDNIRSFIVDHCTEDEVDRIEDERIIYLGTISPNGYNLKSGGQSSNHWTTEMKEAASSSMTVKWKDPDFRSRMEDVFRSDEYVKKQRASVSKAWAEGEMRQKRKATDSLPETKQRKSEAQKDPAHRLRMDVINQLESTKLNRSTAMKEVRSRPEVVAKYELTYSGPAWKLNASIRQKRCLNTDSFRSNRAARDATAETKKRRLDSIPGRIEKRKQNKILEDAKKWMPLFAKCETEEECMKLAEKYEKLVRSRNLAVERGRVRRQNSPA